MEAIKGDVMTTEMKCLVNLVQTPRGGFNFERKSEDSLMADLIKRGFIDPWQEDYIWTFMELRHAWQALSGYQPNGLYREAMQFFATPGRASDFYSLIRHEIGLQRADVMVKRILELVNDKAREMPIQEIDVYRNEVDTLTLAMDNVKESLKKNVAN